MLTRRTLFGAGLGLFGLGLAASLPARAGQTVPEAGKIAFATWTDDEPLYLFYPGDKLEIDFPAAPELNRITQVGPDGRITLGLTGQMMAAYKSVPQLQDDIRQAYAGILRDPQVTVFPGETAPMRVLVGGEVKTPGWVDMNGGDMDALQAIMAAGGFTYTAKKRDVVLIRRGHDGQAMRRIIDLQDALAGKSGELVALRRFDILYVPLTGIGEADNVIQQWINGLIPGGILNYFAYKTFSN